MQRTISIIFGLGLVCLGLLVLASNLFIPLIGFSLYWWDAWRLMAGGAAGGRAAPGGDPIPRAGQARPGGIVHPGFPNLNQRQHPVVRQPVQPLERLVAAVAFGNSIGGGRIFISCLVYPLGLAGHSGYSGWGEWVGAGLLQPDRIVALVDRAVDCRADGAGVVLSADRRKNSYQGGECARAAVVCLCGRDGIHDGSHLVLNLAVVQPLLARSADRHRRYLAFLGGRPEYPSSPRCYPLQPFHAFRIIPGSSFRKLSGSEPFVRAEISEIRVDR